ncbi:MAG: hypothetical protein ABFR36_01115 [Acidobacteriota bacterium]
MKKILLINFMVFLFIIGSELTLSGEDAKKDEEKLPEIGSIYKYQKAEWYVRGAGKKAFEYTATGESLCIITLGIPGSIVKVPEKGSIVRINPEVPMIYIDNKPDKQLKSNTYFKRETRDKIFILLEYKRK